MANKGNQPQISIITVVYNGKQYIEECIESVASQTYKDYEYIIIDGRSSDGTLDIIKKHNHEIDQWISEKDSGIYDAMNKGIKLAKGQWIFFLGCDDKIASSKTLETIAPHLNNQRHKIAFGNVETSEGKIITSKYNKKLLLHNTIHHQSCFYNKELYEKFYYDQTLKLASDYELNLICHLKKIPGIRLKTTIAYCRDGGASTAPQNYELFINETNIVRSRHLSKRIGNFLRAIFLLKARAHNALRHI